MADDFDRGRSPLYARLAREHADDPLLVELGEGHEPRWEVPLRVFAAVHFLALSGRVEDPWAAFSEVVREHRDEVAAFVREQPVQTNEVQRSWALAPAFLFVAAGRPLHLVELGPSAGLNLYWDRYRHLYRDRAWGPEDAPITLAGEAADGPPDELLSRGVEIGSRRGIDRAPLDVGNERDALLLQSFVWADQRDRLERLRRAIEVARRDPPTLVRGDYVEELPPLLAERPPDGLTVVYHSASTAYLPRTERERVAAAIAAAGAAGPLAWISYEFEQTERGDRVGYDRFALDVRVWPGGRARRLARLDGHGNRLRWLDRPL
jgi:hypothetical protein